jgi:hypothetical protein
MNQKTKVRLTILAVILAVLYGMGAVQEHVEPFLKRHGIPPDTLSLLAVLLIVWLLAIWLKRKMLSSMPQSVVLHPADSADLSWLNRHMLETYTTGLTALGFEQFRDHVLQTDKQLMPFAFYRVSVNLQLRCGATIIQMPVGGVHCSIVTPFEQGWELTTTNQPPGALWVFRERKSAWTSHPMMAAGQLLETHLLWREKIARHLGVNILEPPHDEQCQEEAVTTRTPQAREKIRRKPAMLLLLDLVVSIFRPRFQYLGGLKIPSGPESHAS